jgi:outer membrane receptor protein involved in Fe transport
VGSAEFESPIDDKFTVINTNVAKIRSQGVELIANLRLTDALRVTANYTFTDSGVVEGELMGNRVEGAPRNMAALSLAYLPSKGLNLNLRGRFVGEGYQDITNEAFMDSHFIVDLFASYRVHKNAEILLVGENLFDEEYIADGFGQSLGPPRQVSGGVRVRF